jgi:hypothetical protein
MIGRSGDLALALSHPGSSPALGARDASTTRLIVGQPQLHRLLTRAVAACAVSQMERSGSGWTATSRSITAASHFAAIATAATACERPRLWELMVNVVPKYLSYQKQAGSACRRTAGWARRSDARSRVRAST